MKGLDVVLLPEETQKKDLTNHLAVVIDVLRASSTITTALVEGAKLIIPVYSTEEALVKVNTFNPNEVLLCGERNGEKISGFILGNSPLEYNSNQVKGKTLILSTTNGIRTIEMVKAAKKIIVGSFLNVKAVAQYCLHYSEEVILVCAGDRGALSLEDTVCAGMIVELCKNSVKRSDVQSDDSDIALRMYQEFKNDLFKMLKTSVWGKHLIKIGLERDLFYCSQKNRYPYIPIIKNNAIFCLDYSTDNSLENCRR